MCKEMQGKLHTVEDTGGYKRNAVENVVGNAG